MSKININADALAKLKHFSDSGDIIAGAAYAILENEYVIALSAGAKSGNIISVSGTVTKLDGGAISAAVNVVAESVPAVGAGTLTVHSGGGTLKAGTASTKLWFQTTATGTFIIDVTDATAADPCLVRFTLDNGMTEVIALVFS